MLVILATCGGQGKRIITTMLGYHNNHVITWFSTVFSISNFKTNNLNKSFMVIFWLYILYSPTIWTKKMSSTNVN